MKDQNYIEFEAYLKNKLSKEEKLNFETRLKSDLEFNEAFKMYEELDSFLQNKFQNEAKLKAFQQNLETVSNTYFNKKESDPKIIKRSQLYKYAIAACIVLLFGIVISNNFSNPTYKDYSNYDPISLSVRGDQNTLLKTAENAYNTKDFIAANKAFKTLLDTDSTRLELKLYRAISNIELNNFKTADDLLLELRRGSSVYKNKASWYLALSKLKQKQHEVCLQVLKTIPQDAQDYNRAQKLINKLD